MNITHYIGLDVHKDSIAISYAEEGDRKDAIYHGYCGDRNQAAEGALRELLDAFELAGSSDGASCSAG